MATSTFPKTALKFRFNVQLHLEISRAGYYFNWHDNYGESWTIGVLHDKEEKRVRIPPGLRRTMESNGAFAPGAVMVIEKQEDGNETNWLVGLESQGRGQMNLLNPEDQKKHLGEDSVANSPTNAQPTNGSTKSKNDPPENVESGNSTNSTQQCYADLPGALLESLRDTLLVIHHPRFVHVMHSIKEAYDKLDDGTIPYEMFIERFFAMAANQAIERDRMGIHSPSRNDNRIKSLSKEELAVLYRKE